MPASNDFATSSVANFWSTLEIAANTVPSDDPKVIAPNARRDTIRPLLPRRVYCIELISLIAEIGGRGPDFPLEWHRGPGRKLKSCRNSFHQGPTAFVRSSRSSESRDDDRLERQARSALPAQTASDSGVVVMALTSVVPEVVES